MPDAAESQTQTCQINHSLDDLISLTFYACSHVGLVEKVVSAHAAVVLESAAAAVNLFFDQFAQLRFAHFVLLVKAVLALTESPSAHRVFEAGTGLVFRIARFANC